MEEERQLAYPVFGAREDKGVGVVEAAFDWVGLVDVPF